MQHVVQQWWCEVSEFSASLPHSPFSQPAQPTHRSPPPSGSASKPPADPGRTTISANNARSAVVRPPVLKRLDLTRSTILPNDQDFNRGC